MNVLVIGGTRFVGLHIVHALQEAGANVTVFHRGKTHSEQISGLAEVYGDRVRDLHRLGKRTWDAVVDTSAYTPDVVEISTRYFSGKTERYVFISTISVYDYEHVACVDEESPVRSFPAGRDPTEFSVEMYGALKVLCEHRVSSTFRDRALIVRPGLVAGPFDHTDRFTYWPLRVARGGDVLLPESPDHPLRYIDARDFGRFTARAIQRRLAGTYNVVTNPGAATFGSLFEACIRASRASATPRYAAADALLAANVQPWADLPLWIPSTHEGFAMIHASNARARIAGLQLRPVYETARDVLQWARSSGKRPETLDAGLKPERERELLGRTTASMNASALR